MGKQSNPLKANTFKEDLREEVPGEPKKEVSPTRSRKSGKSGDSGNDGKPEKPKKTPRVKKEKKEKKPVNERHYRVLGLFLILVGAYLLLAFASYTQSWEVDFDFASKVFSNFTFSHLLSSAPCENWMGKIGAITAYLFISDSFGVASYLFVIVLLVVGLKFVTGKAYLPIGKTLKYSFFGLVWIPVALSVAIPESDVYYGVYGYEMNAILTDFLGFSGMVMLLVFTLLAFLTLAFYIPFRWFRKKEKKEIPIDSADDAASRGKDAGAEDKEVPAEVGVTANRFKEPAQEQKTAAAEEPEPTVELPVDKEPEPVRETKAKANPEVEFSIENPVPDAAQEPVETGAFEHKTIDTKFDPKLDLPHYKYPSLDLLNSYGGDEISINKEELEANKDRIVDTLKNYSIKIQKIKATIGPTVTLYEIIPEAGIRISRIKNLEDDIALSLSALGIRIIAPIPGKGTIGIEVPNKNPEIVSMKSLLASEKFQKTTYDLPLVLGKTIANETFMVDLAKLPHILMAGATGQGKSVGLNTIITSLLYKKHPTEIKFIMVDPKKVELSLFTKIERHFLAKLPDSEEAIITDTKKVIRTLNSLNIEMDNRYDLLQDAQVRNIREYNDKFIARKLNPNNGHRFLPYLILVVDEFADLIMTAGREIETPLTRLAQLARAIGIHLIIATQRPSVNIITGTIKANFPARIAFRVISKIDSRTILDTGGADQLVGRGDMLLATGSDLLRLQGAFVDTPEIEKMTEFIGSQRGFPDAHHLPEFTDEEGETAKEFDPDSKDELFAEAARLIVQHQQGSTSLIQRRLKLGYNRAGRIIDQLESAGIVGPFEGSKAREVRFKDLTSLEIHLKEIGEV
jgi:DNA segregation ATPase FtsK/SpoIIIE, S-DNA-T family